MKKRIFSALLVLVMIFTLMPTAFAAPTTWQVVTVDKTSVKAGETVNVRVTLPAGIRTAGSFTTNLKFDTTLFEVVSRAAPPKISATDEGYGTQDDVKIVANNAAIANTSGELTANATYVYNTMEVAGVTVIDATLKAKASGVAAFSFSIFEITYSDSGTQYIVKKDQLETPPSVTIPKAPITSVSASVTAPAAGQPLDFTGTVASGAPYSISKVEWFEGTNASGATVTAPATAKAKQLYYARITLTANTGETFAASLDGGMVNSDGYAVTRNSETELYLTKDYPETGSLPAASVGTAPTAKSGLKYNGAEQDLLDTPGTATGGAMQYSLNKSSWSAAIPKGKNAGNYTVYYMVKGDSSHSDYTPASNTVSVTIGQKSIADSTVTIDPIPNQTYTGAAIEPPLVVKDGGTKLTKGTDYTVSYPYNNTNAGLASLQVDGMGNYTGTHGATFNIDRAEQVLTVPGTANVAFGTTLDLKTVCSSNAPSATLKFARPSTSSMPTGTTFNEATGIVTAGSSTGSFSVTVNSAGNANYKDALQKTITVYIVAKTPSTYATEPTARTGLKYNGNAQELVTEGTANGGTVKYSLNGTTWTDTVPTGKNANTYNVQYKIVGDATHSDSTPKTHIVTIGPREVTVSGITAANKVYDGGTSAAVNASGATFGGIVSGDTLTITATGIFADADVGNGKTVNLTPGALGGASVGNYKLAATGNQTTTTADITPP